MSTSKKIDEAYERLVKWEAEECEDGEETLRAFMYMGALSVLGAIHEGASIRDLVRDQLAGVRGLIDGEE